MAESVGGRERPNKGFYTQLSNLTSDILENYQKKPRLKPKLNVFYEVERVISRRVINRKDKYLLKWKGYSHFECSWEDEENLTPDLIRTYDKPLVNIVKLREHMDTFLLAVIAKLKKKSRLPCCIPFHHDCYRHSFYGKGRPSNDGKSVLLDKKDFDDFNFFPGWDYCLDANGDGMVIKYPIKVHTLLSWSPKVSTIQDGVLTTAPRMPQEKLLIDFVRQPFSIL